MLNFHSGRIFMIISTVISSLLKSFVKDACDRKSRKEEAAESSEENACSREGCFIVHKPKFIVPLIVFAIIFFLGFAVFCYEIDILIAMYLFLAFDAFCLYLLLRECCFKIEVDSYEITVQRFLRKTLVCSASDITSCRVDNAGNISVYFGYKKINIESTMINANRFASFASSCAYKNASQLQRKYKVYNKGTACTLIMIAVFICIGALFYSDVRTGRNPTGEIPVIDYVSLLLVSESWWFVYKFISFYKKICVDEKNRTFSYRKSFKLNNASFSQVETIQTKKRFLEENAFNYKFSVRNKNGKLDKIKFSSFEENSDSFFNAVYSTEFEEPEDYSDYEDDE